MANCVLNTVAMAATNVDAYNKTGIYSTGDIQNGTLFTLGAIKYDATTKYLNGFEYAVALAGADAAVGADLWINATAEVSRDLNNLLDDPRNFTNKQGYPMAMKKVVNGDLIELTAEAFGTGDFPEASEVGYFIPTAASGKFGTPVSADPAAKASFKVEALTKMTIGNEEVDACLLRRVK